MAPKRQRQSGEGSSAQEDEPGWTSNGLSTFPERRRPILYKEKIAKLKSIKEAIVAERNVKASDFRCFGLTEGFERLGWEAIFTMNAGKEAKVYINEIVEWMSTLKRVDGDNPPWSVKLIGVVKGVSVEFSLRTVREIIPIDSLEREEYDIRSEAYIKGEEKGDNWVDALSELFEAGDQELTESMTLYASALKPLPRLISKLLIWNINPRKGDKGKVRTYDVRILHAIVTGELKIPFYQVMVMNIWESHESSSRKAIPYCRVLSQLLKNKKVLGKSAKPAVVAATPFDKTHLPKGEFAFSETFLHYVLHDLSTQRKHLVRKPAPEEVQDGVALGEEREYEHHGSLSEAPVYPGRPPAYQHWDTYQRMTWDNTQHHWEVQRLRDEEADRRRSRFEERVEERLARFDRRITRMEQVVAVQGYFQQRYQYDLFDWTEQQRHWADYNNGREYQLHSLRQDFSSLMRTDESGSSRQPIAHPEMNHPDWWPGDYRAHPASGSSSSRDNPEVVDPFDTRDLAQALYEEFFGPNH